MVRDFNCIICRVVFVCLLLSATYAGAQCADPDITGPVITISDPGLLIGECHQTYMVPEAEAEDDCDGPLTAELIDLGGLNLESPEKGSYTITYEAVDAAGNGTQQPFTVQILDTIPPVISQCALSRTLSLTPVAGQVSFPMPDFESRMILISDACDPVVALTVEQSCPPGTPVTLDAAELPAEHWFDITVSDTSANATVCQARVTVVDATAPVITLNGVTPSNVQYPDTCANLTPAGLDCDTWSCGIRYWDAEWQCNVPFESWGATAYDPVTKQDVTALMTTVIVDISTGLPVDQVKSVLGNEYAMVYSVDVAGRTATVIRHLLITDGVAPIISLNSFNGKSGAHPLLVDEFATEELPWVETARLFTAGVPGWADAFPAPYNFEELTWDDAVAMPWDCWFVPYEDPGIEINDGCDGSFSYSDVLNKTLVVLVRVGEDGETFITAEFLGYLQGNFPLLEQNQNNEYRYRLYYFVPDSSGNIAQIARDIFPYYDGEITLAEPAQITLTCDSDVNQFFDELWQLELNDRAYDPCMGDVSHAIVSAGNITISPDNHFVPGTYYREYWIDGYPIEYQEPQRRVIIVEDTLPEIHLLNEDGTELMDEDPVMVLPWCDAITDLTEATDTFEEQVFDWASNWWAALPDYDPLDVDSYGYYVTHPCDDVTQLTSMTQVQGLQELQDAIVEYAQTGEEALLGLYSLAYSLTTPRYGQVWVVREVLLAHDLDLTLNNDGTLLLLQENADSSVYQAECNVPFNLPVIDRLWDVCVDADLTYELVVEIYDGAGNLVTPEQVVAVAPAVFQGSCFIVTEYSTEPLKVHDIEIRVEDTTPPVISLLGDNPMTVECAGTYTEAGATALDICFGNVSGDIVIDASDVNTAVVGAYQVTYNVTDAEGNAADEAIRTVNVVDTTAPIITLLGNNPMIVECASAYTEPGAAALDACYGDISGDLVIDAAAVNTAVVGSYPVTYNVTDAEGNAAVEVIRTVTVVDTTAPVITLLGDNPMTVECAGSYTEAGATALDACFGDLSADIVIDSSAVNTAAVGSYSVTYNVTDAEGNAAVEVIRTVDVVDTTIPVIALLGDNPMTVECSNPYVEPNATAADTCLGDISADIVIDSSAVDTGIVGTYQVTYDVADGEDNDAVQVIRTVNVVDTTPPVITLVGESAVTVECAGSYVEQGATALDACFGDISADIVIDSSAVNVAVVGIYEVTYNVTDAEGNVATEVIRTVTVADTSAPAIQLLGDNPMTIECTGVYVEMGATASDDCFGDISAEIVIDSSAVNTAVVGIYEVTYNVNDAEGNAAVETTRMVEVVDTTSPVITLVGENPLTVECKDVYAEPGATALDDCFGDITADIIIGGVVNTSVTGTYTVTYNVTDAEGNAAIEVTRTVSVVDTTAPVITLNGSANVVVECGGQFTDEGATAMDVCEGDLTNAIVVGGDTVNTVVVGIYVVTYSAKDSQMNTGTANRTVTVVDTTPPIISKCASALTAEMDVDGNVTVPNFLTPVVASDSCDMKNLIYSQDPPVGTIITPPVAPSFYPVVSTVADQSGNEDSCDAWLQILDLSKPVIVMNEVDNIDYILGDDGYYYADATSIWECGVPYDDARAIAYDSIDGDLTNSIVVEGAYQVDSSNLGGEYDVIYTVENSRGATAQAIRHVKIMDRARPAISLASMEGNRSGSTELEVNYEEYQDDELKDMKWLWELKNSVNPPEWLDELPSRFGAYNSPAWNDNTAMLWSCEVPYVDPGLEVADLCDGVLDPADMLVVVVRVQVDRPDNQTEGEGEGEGETEEAEYDEQNENGENEVFIWGGSYTELNAAQIELLNARWYYDEFELYGYRIYYFIKDSTGKQGYISRHVLPAYTWNWISAGEDYIEINCGDATIFDRLHALEQQDRYTTSCLGDVSHLIERSGNIDINTPGEYRRVYTRPGIDLWWADRWGQVWKRTIVVKDTLPEIVLLDESGQPLGTEGEEDPVTQINLCDFADASDAEIEAYFENWWAITPMTGFYVDDNCDNEELLTNQTVVWGDGLIADALKLFAADNSANISRNWLLTYSTRDSLNNNANIQRRVVLAEDYIIDLTDHTGTPLVPDINGEFHISVECGDTFVLPDYAVSSACTNRPPEVEVTTAIYDGLGGPVDMIDTQIVGDYSVVYTITDYLGNETVSTVYVEIVDTIRPLFNLGVYDEELLDSDGALLVECSSAMREPAEFMAADACDVDLGAVQTWLDEGESGVMAYAWTLDEAMEPVWNDTIPAALAYDVFVDIPGDYLLIYFAVDSSGNTYPALDVNGIPPIFDIDGNGNFLDENGELTVDFARLVRVVDTTVPVITLNGEETVEVNCGEAFEDPGAVAADDCDGELAVVVTGEVLTDTPGEYYLVYNATDSAGNVAVTVMRTVTVLDNCPVEGEGEPVEGEGEPVEGEGEPVEGEGEPVEGEGEPVEGEGEPVEGEGELVEGEGELVEGEGEPVEGETDEVAQNLLDLFDQIDLNDDGSLTYEEAQSLVQGLSETEFNTLDTNGDGILSRTELLAAIYPDGITEVPDVVGLFYENAFADILNAGLKVGSVTFEFSDTVPEDHIITQNPAAGTSVPLNSGVSLVQSKGPEYGDKSRCGCSSCNNEDTEDAKSLLQKVLSDWLLVGVAMIGLCCWKSI